MALLVMAKTGPAELRSLEIVFFSKLQSSESKNQLFFKFQKTLLVKPLKIANFQKWLKI
jgi:hypothetical protein